VKRNRNPRFLKQYRDRAGNWVNQYRREGRLVRLPNGRDFTEAFWKAYYAAEAGILAGAAGQQIGEARTRPGTVNAALVGYYRSVQFRTLRPNTQRAIRTSLERDLRPVYGAARIAHLLPKHVRSIVDEKAATAPAGAKGLLTALRNFTRFCVATDLLKTDPAVNIKPPRHRSEGHHTWTEDEIAQFEARWPIGSTPRLAMSLHLYTALRASDVIRLGRQHIGRDGMIRIAQQKTNNLVAVPTDPRLQQVLDAAPKGGSLTLLLDSDGRHFVHGYAARFREWCNAAGLPRRCTSHGIRKAAITRLAEAGCSVSQIAAVSGHRTLSEVQRYTAKVDRERLARQAMAALSAAKTGTSVSSAGEELDKTPCNILNIREEKTP
jgi:integrase